MRYLLAILFCISTVSRVLSQENPPPIPVVKTWEALQELPPIDLGDGVKIRLGLEEDKIPQWSGAFLYCLTEGYLPPTSGSGPTPFGPVYATVAFENEKAASTIERWEYGGKKSKGIYLFVRAVVADRIGTCHITVTNRQSKVIGRDQVAITKDFFHPWMPWIKGLDKPVSPWEGIALPSVDSHGEIAFIEPGKAKKGRLPTLLPNDEKPNLTIKIEGKEIVIRAESEFTTSRPDYHLIARWWVNDKPFVPKQIDRLWIFSGYGRVSEDKELRVEFNFLPERLGAKVGDKIGLQLMHSESQWVWCSSSSLPGHAVSSPKQSENARVSNRIEFDVPTKPGP